LSLSFSSRSQQTGRHSMTRMIVRQRYSWLEGICSSRLCDAVVIGVRLGIVGRISRRHPLDFHE
jgi:hypothetical protein